MIKNLSLSYFRQHEKLQVEFTEGLQVIRGANEAGKSTLLEAIAYALFGTRALGNSLEDVVTWTHPVRNLKVELVISVSGCDYTFSRGKAGAEVLMGGKVVVTGQNEVSAYAASILGTDLRAAAYLTLAQQNALQGVLEEGPKATAQLLEELADMTLFDRILTAAEQKLQLGSTAVLEDRVQQLEAQQAALVSVAKPEVEAHEQDVLQRTNRVTNLGSSLKIAEADADGALKALEDAQKKVEASEKLDADIQALLMKMEATKAQAKVPEGELIDTSAMRVALESAKADVATRKAWEDFHGIDRSWPSLPRAEHTHDVAAIEGRVQSTLAAISSLEADIRVANASIITDMVCRACGQPIKDMEAVLAKNLETSNKVVEMTLEVERQKAALAEHKGKLQVLRGMVEKDAKVKQALARLSAYVTIDDTSIPATGVWVGPDVSSVIPDIQELDRRLAEAEKRNREFDRALATAEAFSRQLGQQTAELQDLVEKQKGIQAPCSDTVTSLQQAFCEQQAAAANLSKLLLDEKERLEDLSLGWKSQLKAWETYSSTSKALEEGIAQNKADISRVTFNNNLVKKIRAARPVIGNKLWQLILQSVSSVFSTMRGEESIVTRGDSEFLINSRVVSSYSGSTKDLLGLAIRVALVKTFVPESNFLILDEPSRGCDSDRTAAMLGYIAACGYDQTILVTHNPMAETFASNIIQL